ncbi:MAG: DUF4350 domain-containing protein [Microthrixaceae bacterium]
MSQRSDGGSGGRSGGRIGLIVVLIGVAIILVISSISSDAIPFDRDSAAPNGYRAIRVLLENRGITTATISARRVSMGIDSLGTAVVVPSPELASPKQLQAFLNRAERGQTVIFGSLPPPADVGDEGEDVSGDVQNWTVENSGLVDAPANLIAQRVCDIAELVGLGRIDSIERNPIELPLSRRPGIPREPVVAGTCYGSETEAEFVEVAVGSGRLFILGSPYLWVNARLQPNKSEGGKVLDNGVTALRLLTATPSGDDEPRIERVLFVESIPTESALGSGTKTPLELIPTPFKALLVGLCVALGVFIWSRATRLGRPVDESAEVTINSSELTLAIGRLFQNDPAYLGAGAESLRREARTEMARAVGVPIDSGPEVLCRAVGQRCGGDPGAVHELLYGRSSVSNAGQLIALERSLGMLRNEVMKDEVVDVNRG